MKNQMKFIAAAALLVAGSAYAQSAGSVMVRVGSTTLSPQVNSGFLSAPDYGDGTKVAGSNNSQLGGGITYMVTDNISVDLPLALPFKSQVIGDGALKGAGVIGEFKSLPATLFLQYRFLESSSTIRPYIGLGATYAYFYDFKGTAKLTATTNPGGPATTFEVDSKFIITPQVGVTFAVDKQWFVDVFYSKSKLNTRTKLSTNQTIDADLDPISYGLYVGYKF